MIGRKQLLILFLFASIGLAFFLIGKNTAPVHAETVTPTPAPSSSQCDQTCWQQKINYYEGQISNLKGQEQTLSSQIAVFDSQINLTQARIFSTEQQITSLTLNISTASQKINDLQSSLSNLTNVLMNRIVATYEVGSIQPMQILLTSGTVGNFLQQLNFLKIAQTHDKQLLYDTVQAKNDYQNQKQIYEDQKKQVEDLKAQLDAYNMQLAQEKVQKQQLLSQTQGSEANYQQLLAQAKAQLAALSNFATSRAGVGGSILPHQDLSDGWGKYYNQRDANWGNNIIGSSGYQIWEVGCLLTSYAMVSTHYGSTVTPGDVAANSSNFWGGTAELNVPGPAPAGHSVSYVQNPSIDSLKNDLSSGAIIIAGLSANGGPSPLHYSDHWVVLRGVDGSGNFMINDPWYQGGMDVSLNDHYSGWTIIEARVYH